MPSFDRIRARAVERCGGEAALEARLPVPKTEEALRAVGDDRYLSLMSLRVFRAGLKHSLVDAKWPAFKTVFAGFAPRAIRKGERNRAGSGHFQTPVAHSLPTNAGKRNPGKGCLAETPEEGNGRGCSQILVFNAPVLCYLCVIASNNARVTGLAPCQRSRAWTAGYWDNSCFDHRGTPWRFHRR